MSADKMPLLLDTGIGGGLPIVDDLFGDVNTLGLPSGGSGKQLQQRIQALKTSGCQQTIAWSKSGAIASITPDGERLELRFLRAHPETGVWGLSEPTTCDVVRGTPTIPLVHLEWGLAVISELAVFDAVGRVTIVSFPTTLNHGVATRKWDNDPLDDLNAVVGCHWLSVAPGNQQKPYNVLYGPGKQQGNTFQYENTFVPSGGPHHPHAGKSALFSVTMGGTLKMFWTQNNSRIEESSLELESVSSSDGLITHAAMASDKKYLNVAMLTASKKLRFARLEIQWAGPGAVQEKSQLTTASRLNPSLVESHLASVDIKEAFIGIDGIATDLTQLHTLPSVIDQSGTNTSPPLILAIRAESGGAGFTLAQTILDRWEAIEERQSLSSTFEQLGTRRNSISGDFQLPTVTRLKKLEPVIIDKVVVAMHSIRFGKVLVLAMADGSVEYRDRTSFEQIYTTMDTDTVTDLRQVGWTFTDEGSCHQVAFSPTCSSKIQLGEDLRLRWSKLHYPLDGMGDSMQDTTYSHSIAAATIATASAVWYMANFDDLVAVMHPLAEKQKFTQDWVGELIRILKIQVDYVEELHHDSLMRNSQLQSCLSIMNNLGFNGEFAPRSFQSKFASVKLNIRNVVILISLANNTPVSMKEKMNPLDEPEVVLALAGCAKWSLDLLSWITESLFELMTNKNFTDLLTPQRFQEVTPFLYERNDISLHLVLSSCSRSFLTAICRRIAHLEDISSRAINFWRQSAQKEPGAAQRPQSVQLQQAYQKMQQVTSSGLIKVGEFEKLLTVLGTDIRGMYHTMLPNVVKNSPNPPQGKAMEFAMKAAQIQLELHMLLAKAPAPTFVGVVRKFFAKELPAFRAQTDPASLFFYDFSLLSEEDDPKSLATRKERHVWVDMFSKTELRLGTNQVLWRRCVRCSAIMEDAAAERPGYRFVLSLQRKCSCGGTWALLAQDKLIP